MSDYDVVVVGAGNAAFCSALAAAVDKGAKVAVLERAPEDDFGGNSRYTAGAIRFAHNGLQDLETVIDINPEERETTDFGVYTADDFYDDKIKKNRNFKCKSTDGIRCDKYKDPEYTVEIKNKFDENTNMFGDIVDNEKKEETPQILTERELMNDDNEDITPPSFTEFGSGVLSSMDEL